MYKCVVTVGNACLINDEKPASFAGGRQMTFWVGHVTLFACDMLVIETAPMWLWTHNHWSIYGAGLFHYLHPHSGSHVFSCSSLNYSCALSVAEISSVGTFSISLSTSHWSGSTDSFRHIRTPLSFLDPHYSPFTVRWLLLAQLIHPAHQIPSPSGQNSNQKDQH